MSGRLALTSAIGAGEPRLDVGDECLEVVEPIEPAADFVRQISREPEAILREPRPRLLA